MSEEQRYQQRLAAILARLPKGYTLFGCFEREKPLLLLLADLHHLGIGTFCDWLDTLGGYIVAIPETVSQKRVLATLYPADTGERMAA